MEYDQQVDETYYNLIKVFLAQSESAVEISKIIADHSEDKVLTGDYIIAGLIYRLMVPMNDVEMKDSLDKAERLLDPEDSGEEDEDVEGITQCEEVKVLHKIKTNHCNCDICSKVRACICNYPNHVCQDELSQKFKDSIESTCKKYLITI